MLAFKTILHPTDFSERSQFAFKLACSLARDHGAKVVLLHVVPPPQMTTYDEVLVPPLTDPNQDLELADRMDKIVSPCPNVTLERRLEEGFAATEIVRLAKELQADLIVLGTHGRSGLGRLLLGSVAEQVLRHAECPVLTVKSPQALAEATGGDPKLAAVG
jgi:nucleotide-binding universal stress UspA family protein